MKYHIKNLHEIQAQWKRNRSVTRHIGRDVLITCLLSYMDTVGPPVLPSAPPRPLASGYVDTRSAAAPSVDGFI